MGSKCMNVVSFLVAFSAVFLANVSGDPGADIVVVDTVEELRVYAGKDRVKVRMKPGIYRIEDAPDHHFLRFTGNDSHYDLSEVTFEIDNEMFSKFGVVPGKNGFYCVIDLLGDRIVFEGLKTVNAGKVNSIQSRNKILNVVGSDIVVRNVEITTHGSRPWGYGSLYGISGKPVRKMNGIRVGAPARNVKLLGCRVHMRAMGHGIFVQGAQNTLIEDCHVDGLLRPTNDILLEESGYAFERDFKATSGTYVEGVKVGTDGSILPDEMISLSEDGIRVYGRGGTDNVPTGITTIRACTVKRMRRGICTGLGAAADVIENCEVTDCVAAAYNIGSGDVVKDCRADARFSEALSCPYHSSENATVDLEILDSRGGNGNTLLATINGVGHSVSLATANEDFVPPSFTVEMGTDSGYAFYQRDKIAPPRDIALKNNTQARVIER